MNAPLNDWLGDGRCSLIGVVHLGPLPGSPRSIRPFRETIEGAIEDALAWQSGGADAILVENFGDAPFFPGTVPPETVAAVTASAVAVAESVDLPIGVNVLRNDGEAALAAAVAAGGRFIRVNALTHAFVSDQGILEGNAHLLLRKRKALGLPVSSLADLLVKHAAPLAPLDPILVAREMIGRGGADGLVVTGSSTGSPIDPGFLEEVAGAAGAAPLFVGSGVTPDNVDACLPHAAGFIVNTWCERDGRIDANRVREIARKIRQ